jgi:hypothetical protein
MLEYPVPCRVRAFRGLCAASASYRLRLRLQRTLVRSLGRDHEAVSAGAMLMNQSSLYHKVGERTAQSSGVETSIFMATKAGSTADDAKVQGCELCCRQTICSMPANLSWGPALLRVRLPHRLTGQFLAAESNRQRLSLVRQPRGNESGAAHNTAQAASLQPQQM